MKTVIRRVVAVATLTLAFGTVYAQFKMSGEIRPRMEYRHGFKTLPDSLADHAISVDQRTRLNFDYKKDRIAFKVTLQDVRTWGSQKQLVGNEDFGASIHEAWGLAKLNDNWGLKFGRMELNYDDARILGNVAWAQQARSHDAILLQFQNDKMKLHIGGAYNQDKGALNTTSYTVAKSYKAMQYAWWNMKFNDNMNMSLLAMGVGQQVDYIDKDDNPAYQDNYTLTTGTRFVYKKDKFGAALNAYYQLGSTNTWPAMDVSGYNLDIDVSYQVADPIKLTLGFEMLSGNSQTDTSAAYNNVQHAFNPYFGTNHKFNGYMDYFYVGNHIGSVGLNDIYLRVDYKHEKFSAGLTGHAFMANADVLDVDWLFDAANTAGEIRAMSPYLGAEIDLFGGFKLAPGAMLKFGYSQMIGTRTMELVKGGDTDEIANWGWAMIILKPTLFDSSKKEK
jgi:hypothetical protein